MGLGGTARGLKETELGRQYDYREAQRSDPMRGMQFVQGFAPQYQGSSTQVNKTYGMPVDPAQYGLSAGLGTYASLYGNQNQGQGYGSQ